MGREPSHHPFEVRLRSLVARRRRHRRGADHRLASIDLDAATLSSATAEIEQRDYLVADVPMGASIHRTEVRTNVILTRTLRLKSFDMEYDAEYPVPEDAKAVIIPNTVPKRPISVAIEAIVARITRFFSSIGISS